jgi:tetratricopeptide (TPR) repeat protein
MGNAAAGMQDAREAIRLSPRLAQAHLALADALLAAERDAEAVAALQTASECDPGNAEIHVEIAEITWRNLGNKTAALGHLQQAIDLNPALVRAQLLLGSLQLELGDRDVARKTVSVLRRLAPDSREVLDLERAVVQP